MLPVKLDVIPQADVPEESVEHNLRDVHKPTIDVMLMDPKILWK